MMTTTREIAEIAGVDIRTVRNWIKAGKIQAEKVGPHWRVNLDEVAADSPVGLKIGGSDQSQTVSFTPIMDGDYLVAIDGRPIALIDQLQFLEILAKIHDAMRSGSNRAIIDIRKRVNSDGQGDEPRTG